MNCQIPCLRYVAEGPAGNRGPMGRRLKLSIRRHLSSGLERTLKIYTNDLMNRVWLLMGRETKPAAQPAGPPQPLLQQGDKVRVRSREEIESTLNNWKQLKGCAFMPEMAIYCDSSQRVWKRMERFVDERDLRVKRSKGIILLEGVFCQGTAGFGACDRSCFVFWREEWLEKIE